jgi:hypothetical protein
MTSIIEREPVDEAARQDVRELFATPPPAPVAPRAATDPLPFMTVDPEWQPPPESHPWRRWALGGLVGLVVAGAVLGARVLSSGSATEEPMTLQPGPSALVAVDSAPSLPTPASAEGAAAPGHLRTVRAPVAAPPVLAPSASVPAPAPTAAALRRRWSPGRLFINSTPWGEVYVDDVLIGNTPRPDLGVPAGVHRVRVVRDGFQPFELTLRVAPGEVVRLTDIVLKERVP